MPIDYAKYPSDWWERRARILERAGEERDESGQVIVEASCEWCNAENYAPHPVTDSRVVLTVAHLDHDADNADVADDRLAALCQRCHLGYDRSKHLRKRKYGNDIGQEFICFG